MADHRKSSAVDPIDELEGFPSDAVTARYPVYTRGNVGEVLPHALSPLMVSVSAVMDEAQRDALEQMGVMQRSELGDGRVYYPCFNGCLYLNLPVFLVVSLRLRITTEPIDNAI